MPRTVKEWIGKTDDSPPPPRVKLRIWQRENGACHISGRKIQPGESYQFEHKVALINGGENRETNIYLALVDKHKEKTKADLAEKSRVAERAKSHAGIARPAGKLRGPKFRKVPRAHEDRGVVSGESACARQIRTVSTEGSM